MTEHTKITARRRRVRSMLMAMMASKVYSATLAPTWQLSSSTPVGPGPDAEHPGVGDPVRSTR
jgi:hypothetical protein